MNIFVNGKFYSGGFNICDGRFSNVLIAGNEDISDDEYVIPGLVEVHSHGRTRADFSFLDGDDHLKELLTSYAKAGVTSVLGTTMTNNPEIVEKSIQSMGRVFLENSVSKRARLLGIHMEGPFLGKDKKGAHDSKYLSDFDKNWLVKLIEKSNNSIRLITIDPKLPDSKEFIGFCRANGIRVSLGHTSADYETAVSAFSDGADHVTHMFNAMNSFLHRAPGLVGAAFDKKPYVELICDGVHLHPSVIRTVFSVMPEKTVVISDSMQAAGLTDGVYSLGGMEVFVKNKKAVLGDGTIAGSCTDLFNELRNLVSFGIPLEQAIDAVTINPARSIGMEKEVGSISKGCYADYIVMDKDLNIQKIYIGGNEICTI